MESKINKIGTNDFNVPTNTWARGVIHYFKRKSLYHPKKSLLGCMNTRI